MHGLGHMTVSEMLGVMHENDLFDTFSVLQSSKYSMIPARSCSTELPFSPLPALIENLPL